MRAALVAGLIERATQIDTRGVAAAPDLFGGANDGFKNDTMFGFPGADQCV